MKNGFLKLKRFFKILFWLIAVLIVSAVILDVHIRHERKSLQARARAFLSRSVPDVLNTNLLGLYSESQDGNVLIRSRRLIERYANNGRIRWSAVIQAQFATAPFGISACEDVAKTNDEVRIYVAECQSILDKEWRMGFWQWVEDTMEFKQRIPEIEEEDFKTSVTQVTNNSATK